MKGQAIAGLFFLLTIGCANLAHAITPEKERDIKALLEIMGVFPSMGEQMADAMVAMAVQQERKRNPSMPAKVEYALSTAVRDTVMQEIPKLDQMVVPLYDKYYTHEDIKKLTAFFSSDIGRKYSAVLGPMMKDMTPVAQQWGERVGPIAAKKAEQVLKKYGYR